MEEGCFIGEELYYEMNDLRTLASKWRRTMTEVISRASRTTRSRVIRRRR